MSVSLTVFESDYRAFLEAKINETGSTVTRLSEAAKCQRSHISRVLNGQLHLTMEQAFRLSRHWKLEEEEETYFLKLVERDRSGDPLYRQKIQRDLENIRAQQENLSHRLKSKALSSAQKEATYYSTWYWSAIHIIVSIPGFQTVSTISTRLQLPAPLVEQCLKQLEEFGLVQKRGESWKFTSTSLHLPKSSPINSTQHFNWRNRAVADSQNPETDGLHYTIVQSISRKDFESLKQDLLRTIDRYGRVAGPSKEEELICFACDFFRV